MWSAYVSGNKDEMGFGGYLATNLKYNILVGDTRIYYMLLCV